MSFLSELNWLDALGFFALFVSCMVGFWRGLAYEVLSLTAWVGAFFSAQWGSVVIEQFLPSLLPSSWHWVLHNSKARYALAFALAFIGMIILLGWCAALVRRIISKTGLRPFDRVLGAGFGLLRMLLVFWVLVLLVEASPLQQTAWWKQSRLAVPVKQSLRVATPLLPEEIQQWMPQKTV